jgi:hypothetical protein
MAISIGRIVRRDRDRIATTKSVALHLVRSYRLHAHGLLAKAAKVVVVMAAAIHPPAVHPASVAVAVAVLMVVVGRALAAVPLTPMQIHTVASAEVTPIATTVVVVPGVAVQVKVVARKAKVVVRWVAAAIARTVAAVHKAAGIVRVIAEARKLQ